MLTYDEAKKLIDVFTDVKNVTTDVELSYVMPYGSRINETPNVPYVDQISIDYVGNVNGEIDYLTRLQIVTSDELGEAVGFVVSTLFSKDHVDGSSEITIKRADFISDLVKKFPSLYSASPSQSKE